LHKPSSAWGRNKVVAIDVAQDKLELAPATGEANVSIDAKAQDPVRPC